MTAMALQHLDESFRSDRRIVTAAVRRHGESFQYASKHLRGDEDVVLMAMSTPRDLPWSTCITCTAQQQTLRPHSCAAQG